MVEGEKSVLEILKSDYDVTLIVSTPAFKLTHYRKLNKKIEWLEASEDELASMGSFKTNQSVLVVSKMKEAHKPENASSWVLVLDDIRDPGNLGTIIRTADWYGIKDIVVSEETADFYNPKVLHASMGSFCRVSYYTTDLPSYLAGVPGKIYGTFLKGVDLHTIKKPIPGHLVIGNESEGIHPYLEKHITDKITIPGIGGAESLNAAVATGIVLDNLIRLQK